MPAARPPQDVTTNVSLSIDMVSKLDEKFTVVDVEYETEWLALKALMDGALEELSNGVCRACRVAALASASTCSIARGGAVCC